MFILPGHLNHNKGLFQITHNCYAIVDLLPIFEVFKKHIKMKKPRVIILFPKSRQSFFCMWLCLYNSVPKHYNFMQEIKSSSKYIFELTCLVLRWFVYRSWKLLLMIFDKWLISFIFSHAGCKFKERFISLSKNQTLHFMTYSLKRQYYFRESL